jgi:uncharacterized protein YegL
MAKKKNAKGPVNVQFADKYEGCQVVANIMGLNVETVRKRAKSGKIPAAQDAKGTWVFTHAALVAAGIEPFASGKLTTVTPPTVVAPKKVNLTDVIFVLDGSGSMSGLLTAARQNLDAQIKTLRNSAGPNDVYRVSIINFDSTVRRTLLNTDVTNLTGGSGYYIAGGGMTALYDAIANAITLANNQDDGERAFLISIVTDGAENQSGTSESQLAAQIRTAQGKDRFTFAYAGPHGSEGTAIALGIPAGNCTSWDQSVRGTQMLGAVQTNSLGTYTRSRSVGVLKSTSFYAQPTTTNAANFANQLDDKLDDVTKDVTVHRVTDKDPLVINKFCEKKLGVFEKGKNFYQLTESEKVQDYKQVVIQDNATGAFYSGWKAAKKLLGIPDFKGTVQIKPGNLGDFKVFIQSTSTNRKLVPGTTLVHLP